ncbi:hypothetical protein ACN2C7_10080 [Caulobacter sp. ErkDOM-E]|uniref:hypothetical protein n=1 Tax=Caulobacter sp. ErkDOM-E TaxID=3402778 RepID=UPI003AF6A843
MTTSVVTDRRKIQAEKQFSIAAALRPLIDQNIHSSAAMLDISERLDIPLRTLYTKRKKLSEGLLMTSALAPQKPGPKPGFGRYAEDVEDAIARVIKREGLTRQNLQPAKLLRAVEDECRIWEIPRTRWPKIKGLKARLARIEPREWALRTRGERAAEPYTATPGEFPQTTRPNECWLIDHTPVDLILLDRRTRMPLGRPTATLFDRCI